MDTSDLPMHVRILGIQFWIAVTIASTLDAITHSILHKAMKGEGTAASEEEEELRKHIADLQTCIRNTDEMIVAFATHGGRESVVRIQAVTDKMVDSLSDIANKSDLDPREKMIRDLSVFYSVAKKLERDLQHTMEAAFGL